MRASNARVNILRVAEAMSADSTQREQALATRNRTVWHSFYDQGAGSMEVSFYLGEDVGPDGTRREHRSEYLTFGLGGH